MSLMTDLGAPIFPAFSYTEVLMKATYLQADAVTKSTLTCAMVSLCLTSNLHKHCPHLISCSPIRDALHNLPIIATICRVQLFSTHESVNVQIISLPNSTTHTALRRRGRRLTVWRTTNSLLNFGRACRQFP